MASIASIEELSGNWVGEAYYINMSVSDVVIDGVWDSRLRNAWRSIQNRISVLPAEDSNINTRVNERAETNDPWWRWLWVSRWARDQPLTYRFKPWDISDNAGAERIKGWSDWFAVKPWQQPSLFIALDWFLASSCMLKSEMKAYPRRIVSKRLILDERQVVSARRWDASDENGPSVRHRRWHQKSEVSRAAGFARSAY